MSTRLDEAAVIGMRHAELGEEVGAAVALKPGMSRGAVRLRQGAGCRVLVPAGGVVHRSRTDHRNGMAWVTYPCRR